MRPEGSLTGATTLPVETSAALVGANVALMEPNEALAGPGKAPVGRKMALVGQEAALIGQQGCAGGTKKCAHGTKECARCITSRVAVTKAGIGGTNCHANMTNMPDDVTARCANASIRHAGADNSSCRQWKRSVKRVVSSHGCPGQACEYDERPPGRGLLCRVTPGRPETVPESDREVRTPAAAPGPGPSGRLPCRACGARAGR